MKRSTHMRRDNQDRISILPDCLLHLIMSFLTAHEAVRMSVLSKRWRNLWTTLPFLDFDLDRFRYMTLSDWYDSEFEYGEIDRYARMFRNFVSMTLLLREATDLLKFRLSCSEMQYSSNYMFISSWIRYALKHNPQVLEINICRERTLPLGLFSCASLVDLSLFFPYKGPSPVVNLPCITRLHLRYLFLNQDFVKKVLCGCPVLEFLHLQHCDMEFSSIHSESLKYLEIEGNCYRVDGGITMDLIKTPNLLSFYYNGCAQYIGHKVLLNMPSLTSAIISMHGCTSHPFYNVKSKILTGISSVKSAKLSGAFIKELLDHELPNLPKFQNANELSVNDLCLKCNFNLLASFIEHFPNLKILSLCHASPSATCYCEVKVRRKRESLKIAPFKCKQLQTVNVKFRNCDKKFRLVLKYLQDGTKNLGAKINMTFI